MRPLYAWGVSVYTLVYDVSQYHVLQGGFNHAHYVCRVSHTYMYM